MSTLTKNMFNLIKGMGHEIHMIFLIFLIEVIILTKC